MSAMRLSPNGNPVVVQTGASIIVEDEQGQILMQQRQDDGTWSYPGGRIEIDETVEDGARREVREDCGLEVGKLRLLGVFSGKELNHVYPTATRSAASTSSTSAATTPAACNARMAKPKTWAFIQSTSFPSRSPP